MELRTTFKIERSPYKITYNDKVMMIGSCFASAIGSQMEMGRMPVMINPSGTVFNPVSVSHTIDTILSGREYGHDDLYCHDGTYLSFAHYTDFSSADPDKALQKINESTKKAYAFMEKVKLIVFTFGTAKIYRWNKTGRIVSNCHKIPASKFTSEMLTVNEICDLWTKQLDSLQSLFPDIKIIFTVSPVRHLKDGAHSNQVSKSVLFLAIEELLKHPVSPSYFPAYELLIDDLRDYRFYGEDMVHPSTTAVNYIWDLFSGCYMDEVTIKQWKEIVSITKACRHNIKDASVDKLTDFAGRMLERIKNIESKSPEIDLSIERIYFQNILDV